MESDPPVSRGRGRGTSGVCRVQHRRLARFSRPSNVDPAADRFDRRVPTRTSSDGLAEPRRIRHEDPARVRRLGIHPGPNTPRSSRCWAASTATSRRLLSAHQSIGLPQPLKHLRQRKNRRSSICLDAQPEPISAFALTENSRRIRSRAVCTTSAELTPEGDAYILNGEKLWCTNGTISRSCSSSWLANRRKSRGSARSSSRPPGPGSRVEHRCRFMGLKALANAVIRASTTSVCRGRTSSASPDSGPQDRPRSR